MNNFTQKIRAAIQDQELQSALDANAVGRQRAWKEAFEAMPYDLAVMREKAHNIRKEVIDNLDAYLEQFVQQAETNGFLIHRAANAEQANQIVLEIAREHDAKMVAKSKTMVSEEIELNHALEAAGIRPVETDLGEYIVQLRKEKPGHIITPAVHLKRDQVGRTFEEHLGIPYTEDIPILTETARKTLREAFMTADIGLSGVNLAIAKEGAIGILTNEGNGRMVTSVPPVHIALLGIERLVPTYEDFCTMLAVLPRASTGQPITVYTQIIRGPRGAGETDGAQERHIVLVDNGRRRTQSTWLSEALMCIRCGACLNACPVFREIAGHAYVDTNDIQTPYSGPIGSVISPALFGEERYGHLAQASSLCGACKDACPVDIDLPSLLLRVRAGESSQESSWNADRQGIGIAPGVRLGLKAFTWAAAKPRRFFGAQKMAGVFSHLLGDPEWLNLPAFTGWGVSKDIHKPARVPFRQRWTDIHQQVGTEIHDDAAGGVDHTVEERSGERPDLLDEYFARSLRALDGTVIECSQSQVADYLVEELANRGIKTVAVWESLTNDYPLAEAFTAAGIRIDPDISKAQAGITGASAAVAETGSVVITSAPDRPGKTSLFPSVHIVILDQNRIYENLPQVFQLEEVRKASAVTIVSGPSRTADIEMTLTIGVHGPGEVIVFLLR